MLLHASLDPPTSSEVDLLPAFEGWYTAAWPALVAFLTLRVHDTELAQDLAAEACARAYARWDRRRPENIDGWVYAVALNLVRRHARRAALERALVRRQEESEASPVVACMSPELRHAIGSLPRRQRDAVELRYFADLRQADIARALGIAPGTVAATLHAARKNLRAVLTDPETEET